MNNNSLNNSSVLPQKNNSMCNIDVLKLRLIKQKKREKQKKQIILATIVASIGVAGFFIS